MAKNIIFYFTGTGNSLKAARDIAAAVGSCELAAISGYKNRIIPDGYERIGVVFPVYAAGPPNRVKRFLAETDFSACHNAYFFAAATCGGYAGNSFPIVRKLLKDKGITLDAAFPIRSFANFVALYNMSENGGKIQARAKRLTGAAAERVLRKERTKLRTVANPLFTLMHGAAKRYPEQDKGFQISHACAACGLCVSVCPAKNIALTGGRPDFRHRCEQCMACIQLCPNRAIDYKNKTQKRRRYINPYITPDDLKHTEG